MIYTKLHLDLTYWFLEKEEKNQISLQEIRNILLVSLKKRIKTPMERSTY